MYAAMGILMALLDRERSGKGQWIQTSPLESLLAVMRFSARTLARSRRDPDAGGQRSSNHHPHRQLSHPGWHDLHLAYLAESAWTRLCKTLGHEDWLTDPRFETNKARSANRDRLNTELSKIFSGNTTAHWIALLNGAGLAVWRGQ
ncbi:CoA transferase [Cupriavidus basilensis]